MDKIVVVACALLVAACASGDVEQRAASITVRAEAGYALGAPQLVVRAGVLSVHGALCAGAAPPVAPPREVVLVTMSTSGAPHRWLTPLRGGPLVGGQQRCAFYAQEVGPAEAIREISICAGRSCV